MKNTKESIGKKVSLAGIIITLGIVFGDIGTSPLYVMKAILVGSGGNISKEFILGAASAIIWTLTLQTTLKYVLITLRADNKGEGGILALYALLRKRKKWLFSIAIIGGSALLADGVITPSITVMSAVEGLQLQYPKILVIPVAIFIIISLFTVQQFGTSVIGKSFGPIMLLWFTTLALLGLPLIFQHPAILQAFNPYYAFHLIITHPNSLFIMGAVFLATTGAEALYSDLGHCGVNNIRYSWIYVKISLIINYLGQSAWIILQASNGARIVENPFYAIMPNWFLPFGVLLATLAAIIASQALISGTYTIISEAIQLNLWPKLRISYPTNRKGQMYISSINWVLMLACLFVILLFQSSSNMEAAYGLSITITMLMTTFLMIHFLKMKHINRLLRYLFASIYFTIEIVFLVANITKFTHGGWFTILLAGIIAFIMYTWFTARRLKNNFTNFVKISDYYSLFEDLMNDNTISKYSSNLVYLTRADNNTDIEAKIMYSIFNKKPKRSERYWMVHLHICDDPHTMEYTIDQLIPGKLVRIEFRIGFKVQPKVNLFFRQVLNEMVKNGEIDISSTYPSLKKHHIPADFRFVLIKRIQNYDFDFPTFYQFIMDVYVRLTRISISDIRAYGLDTSTVVVEQVPLVFNNLPDLPLKRI